jgi:hypothetical protein
MKKLTGTDVITLIKASSKNEVMNEAINLSIEDFNHDDLIVKTFFASFPQGFKNQKFASSNKEEIANQFLQLKKEITEYSLRKAYNLIQNARSANNDVVKCENVVLDSEPLNPLQSQFKAAQLTDFLSKFVDGKEKQQTLSNAHDAINAGELEKASDYVYQVFAGVNKNIRTAFTTIKNQIGESYQLCPKGIYIWGSPRPMALSNCREYCIDARLHPDGTVSCNYLKWLNDNLMTQEQALNVPDKMKYNDGDSDGEIEYMELPKGVRTKFPMSDQDSQDSRIIRDVKNNTKESWESQLEKEHEKASKRDKPEQAPKIISDSAIELLLKDIRDNFDDDDLDVLEAEIRKAMGE